MIEQHQYAAKNVKGIWLPEEEKHFAESPHLGARYPVLEKALALLPKHRRRTAIDIGAHIGLWSRWLVQEFDFVHAFEPVPEYAAIFRKNVTAPHMFLHRCALGDASGSVAIKKYPDDTGRAHVCGSGSIDMWTLDMFDDGDVDLIKIDVEGYELPVVKGGERLLLKNKPVVVIEQRGIEELNFRAERDAASKWLEGIGMKTVERVGADLIMRFE